jgi:transcriptional antiterminator NusG
MANSRGKRWFVLQVISGKEKGVLRNLEFMKSMYEKNPETQGIIGSIRVPEEDTYEIKNGKKRAVKTRILPGYILIEVDFPNDIVEAKKVYSDIVMVNGVGTFIGGRQDGLPLPVADQELEDILMRMGELKKTSHKPTIAIYFEVGDKVRVISGPLKDSIGKVESIDMERKKVVVRIDIFGMPTPVDLDVLQVEKI